MLSSSSKNKKREPQGSPIVIHPERIELPSQEPESYVISITLRVATMIVYQKIDHFTSKKSLPKQAFYVDYNSISPNKSAIENPV